MPQRDSVIRVLVVDDQPIVRAGIEKSINASDDMRMTGDAPDIGAALEKLKVQEHDVLLLDVSNASADSLNAVAEVRRRHPSVRVLVLAIYANDEFAVRALQLGASGYLTKEIPCDELVQAIRQVSSGRRYVSASIAERLAETVATGITPAHLSLTSREYQVFLRTAGGSSTRKIAIDLGISAKTVATHRARVFEKMHIKGVAQLAIYAVRNKLLD